MRTFPLGITFLSFALGLASVGRAPAAVATSSPSPLANATASPAASAVVSPDPAPSAAATVHVHDFAFVPRSLHVRAGQTVRFINDDSMDHDVFAVDGSFGSPELDRGAAFSHTFRTAGTVEYLCNDHVFMRGTIVVDP